MADIEKQKPMSVDAMGWIASMTKPITGAAILMLQDEGRLNIADPVSEYLPESAALKTPSGKPTNLTITQVLTHTSGLGEAKGPKAEEIKCLSLQGPQESNGSPHSLFLGARKPRNGPDQKPSAPDHFETVRNPLASDRGPLVNVPDHFQFDRDQKRNVPNI